MQHFEDLSLYNAPGTTTKKVQDRLLDMLIEFDKVCRKHNINYFLSGGTCLGAVRHGGFIPWDDDIDIDVWYQDYPKLLKALENELPSNLKLQTPKTDKGYYHFYARIVDLDSEVFYKDNFARRNLKYKGLFLDIIPISNSISFKLRKLLNRRTRLAYSMSRVGAKKKLDYYLSFIKLPVYLFAWFIYSLLSKIKRTDKVSHYYPSIYNPKLSYKNCFPVKKINFEGYEFLGPNKPHEYLVSLYGDNYMETPEPSKRITHSNKVIFK